jgi:hypothetical protein
MLKFFLKGQATLESNGYGLVLAKTSATDNENNEL